MREVDVKKKGGGMIIIKMMEIVATNCYATDFANIFGIAIVIDSYVFAKLSKIGRSIHLIESFYHQ